MNRAPRIRGSALPSRRPLLYYITDRRQLPGGSLAEVVRRAVLQGIDVVQIREKDLPDRELYELAAAVISICRGSKTRVVVNGRPDVALAAGASGVHLPARGLPPAEVRRAFPRDFLLGVSTHAVDDVRAAQRSGADYVLFGPLFPTPSKLPFGPPVGLEALESACRVASIPVLALGGMTPERIEAALERGAAGIAGISMFQKQLSRSKGARGAFREKVLSG